VVDYIHHVTLHPSSQLHRSPILQACIVLCSHMQYIMYHPKIISSSLQNRTQYIPPQRCRRR